MSEFDQFLPILENKKYTQAEILKNREMFKSIMEYINEGKALRSAIANEEGVSDEQSEEQSQSCLSESGSSVNLSNPSSLNIHAYIKNLYTNFNLQMDEIGNIDPGYLAASLFGANMDDNPIFQKIKEDFEAELTESDRKAIEKKSEIFRALASDMPSEAGK